MIRFCTFTSNERNDTLTFCPAESLGDAVRKVRDNRADGLCIDVVDQFGDLETSYEVSPGRPLVIWWGGECHE